MGWKRHKQGKGKRRRILRAELEDGIANVVKGGADCGDFVGVIVEWVKPNSPSDANWALKGIKYGAANRGLCDAILSTCIAEKTLRFDLAD
jgi:hypothetical protein